MALKKRALTLTAAVALATAISTLLVPQAWGAKYKVLHAFGKGGDGAGLWGSLLLDSKGNVYGTTVAGGEYGGGTAFELTPQPNGSWAEAVLYGFCSKPECTDGGGSTAGLTSDAAGNLYGTTQSGGAHVYGTVFELTPQSNGTWVETVLYNFPIPGGGCCPYGGVAIDKSNNLYGATYSAFELSPGSNGWTATVLHNFTGRHGDGSGPYAAPILDAAGNLYGTTEHGGYSKGCGGGCGAIYELSPRPGGKWKETILFGFQTDGAFPGVGALALDRAGNLYGTTTSGTIFKLTPGTDGHWKFTVLYIVADEPAAGVVIDKSHNLYGTTINGGDYGCGDIYKLAPGPKGKWTYTVLHSFTGADGCQPDANLILDRKGNLYGTTATGGAGGAGVAFELTP